MEKVLSSFYDRLRFNNYSIVQGKRFLLAITYSYNCCTFTSGLTVGFERNRVFFVVAVRIHQTHWKLSFC